MKDIVLATLLVIFVAIISMIVVKLLYVIFTYGLCFLFC